MNTLSKIFVSAALTLGAVGLANAKTQFVPANDYVTTKICMSATKGSKARLNQEIKQARLSKQFIVENVKCNQQNIIKFVELHGTNVVKINNFLTSGKYATQTTIVDLASL